MKDLTATLWPVMSHVVTYDAIADKIAEKAEAAKPDPLSRSTPSTNRPSTCDRTARCTCLAGRPSATRSSMTSPSSASHRVGAAGAAVR